MANAELTIITPSYRNDYELAVDLCASMDRYLQLPFKHLLVVPRSDMALFAPLRAANRVLVAKEDFLRQFGFFKLPFPKRIRIPGLVDIRTREQWYRPGIGRVSGWLVQQIIKLAAPQLCDSEYIMFIDSDNVLFRPVSAAQLYGGMPVKLPQKPMKPDMHEHLLWHRNALELLGVTDFQDEPHNYIDHLIIWHRDAVLALQQRVAQVAGGNWVEALARKKAVSEYILYGVYCATLGRARGYHVFGPPDLTCSFWSGAPELPAAEVLAAVKPSHVNLHIQSTIPMPQQHRRALLRELAAHQTTAVGG
ncbi:hypothetical protein GJ697_24485 [Pseudoduganella sp. FT25W]|jgi:hypothetical protein|uniref:Glycosyl transferase n=1 Tax=Duganella alba TaxID=2666081 RepID=A0A6L5QMU5_9BURK|nr:DUF6492 family protein [Duganella alba]MRX10985.1 hypothetical protein [Duganella alba]MRX19170.1 hypothetical protein [Duganella alba]